MTGAEIMAVAGFILLLFAQAFAVWRYVEGKITAVRTEAASKIDAAAALATLSRGDLAQYKTHVAETYVSKQGHRESTEMLLSAITDVKTAIDGTNLRIDRMLEAKPRRTT